MNDSNYYKKLDVLKGILGEPSYNYPSPEIAFYCPVCNHRKKKLMINLEKNVFKCWVCGKAFAGTVPKMITVLGHRSKLAEWNSLFSDISLTDVDLKTMIEEAFKEEKTEYISKIIELPKESKFVINDSIFNPFKNYLYNRGLNNDIITKYQIHYCDEGEYKNRVIIPSFDSNGSINYFVGRAIYKSMNKKYVNQPINKNSIIFNELFIDWSYPIILVEGIFDAIKVNYNAIPLLGNTLDESLLEEKIMKYKPSVFVMLDNEKKAREQQLKIIETLITRGIIAYDVKIKKKDPGSMSFSEVRHAISKAHKNDRVTFETYIKHKLEEA